MVSQLTLFKWFMWAPLIIHVLAVKSNDSWEKSLYAHQQQSRPQPCNYTLTKNFCASREMKEKDLIKYQKHIYANAGKTETLHSYLFLITLWDICQCCPCFCVIPEHRMAGSKHSVPACRAPLKISPVGAEYLVRTACWTLSISQILIYLMSFIKAI